MITLVFLLPLVGILAHEMGHALVALVVTRGPVRVVVGRSPGRIRLRLGRLHVSYHVEASRGVAWHGVCFYEIPTRPLREVGIAVAGPLMSLAFAVSCFAAIRVSAGTFGRLGVVCLGFALLQGVASMVRNGQAIFSDALAKGRPRTDGAIARRRFKEHLRIRTHERMIGRRLTDTEIRLARASGRIPASALVDIRVSVPPPG